MDVSIELRPAESTRDQISVTLITVLILVGCFVFVRFLPTYGRLMWCSFEAVGIVCFVVHWRRGWKNIPPWLVPRWTTGSLSLYGFMLITILRDFGSLAHDLALGKLPGILP
jgi:hypothetical protein